MRAPRSGCSAANSLRIAMRPGISVSAILISLRPQSCKRQILDQEIRLRLDCCVHEINSFSGLGARVALHSAASISALSVRSQLNSSSLRPKWP